MTALARSMPFIIRNSSVLSSMAESDPSMEITGRILEYSSSMSAEFMLSSRASMRLALPRMVLISPLWQMIRLGCARCQEGVVLVENRLCTSAIADL